MKSLISTYSIFFLCRMGKGCRVGVGVSTHLSLSNRTACARLFINDLIYDNRTEFRKNLNTETTLANLIDSLQFNLDCNRVNGMVTVDYKKHLIWSTIRFSLLNLKFIGWIPVPQPGSDAVY